MSRPADWAAVVGIAGELSAELERHAARIVGTLREQLPSYTSVPADALVPGVTTSLVAGLQALTERRPPDETELAALASVAADRAHQQIPLDALLGAYRLGAQHVWEELRRRAEQERLPADLLLVAAEVIWRWSDTVSASVAAAHRRAELALARRSQLRQSSFVPALLQGRIDRRSAAREAAAHGLDIGLTYRAFRCVPVPPAGPEAADPVVLGPAGTDGAAVQVGMLGGDLVGVTAGRFDPAAARRVGLAIGVGPPVPVEELDRSFVVAGHVVEAAVRLGRPGVFELCDLGVLVPVSLLPEVGDELVRRYLEPLAQLRQGGQPVREALDALLESGLRLDEAARRIPVHPNTLRYRIRRYEAVTGVELRRIDELVGLWWALHHEQVAGHEPSRGGGPARSQRPSRLGPAPSG